VAGGSRAKRNLEGVEHLAGDGKTNLAEFERGVREHRLVDAGHIVEEIAGDSGVRLDGGRLEAEVRVVGEDLFVDGVLAVRDRNRDRQRQRDLRSYSGFQREENALHVVDRRRGENGVVGRDEVDAGIVEVDGEVGIIGDDDADGHQAVIEVVEPRVRAILFRVAGDGGDGDVLLVVRILHLVLVRGQRRLGLARLVGKRSNAEEEQNGQKDAGTQHWFNYPLQDDARAKQHGPNGGTMLIYSALLTLGLLLSSPWWLLRMATTQRYREGLRERLGAVPARLKTFVSGKRFVWIHAVSVGEVLAASRLVGELEAALGENWRVVVSTTTRTGQALARERFGAERVFYFPLDFAFAVRAYLTALGPAVLVLMESELWPRMLHECERKSVPVVVVNARVSDRSFARAMKVKTVWGRVLRKVSLWLVQSEEDATRLVAMGVTAESVRIGGNLKYDVRAPKVSRVAELIMEVAAGRPIVVAGSTVNGETISGRIKGLDHEEGYLLSAYGGRIRNEIGAMLVIAPRHPERFEEAWNDAIEFPTLRASELLAGKKGPDAFAQFLKSSQIHQADVIVLDTIGDLAAVYEVAHVAFVGGSLVKRGGHNPLEPAQFGTPVVMGTSFENFREIVEKMKAAGGIAIVEETAGLSAASAKGADSGRDDSSYRVQALEAKLVEFLTNQDAARAMGERGRQVFEEQQGATRRAVEAIVAVVKA
jgi:3-deoxy-D-manno-octulosonic-acid transferase